MQKAQNMASYHEELKEVLADPFIREILDKIAVDFRNSRERIFSVINGKEHVAGVAAAKDYAMDHYDELFARFKEVLRHA